MARLNYRKCVAWIAENDNVGANDTLSEIGQYMTVVMLADMAGKTYDEVAGAVLRHRKKLGLAE